MGRKEDIDKEIEQLRNEYDTVHGTKTEVYTRIVGYYRNVGNFNKGKAEEYRERLDYVPVQVS
jgi:anaerobic ribonucleoside-triphosphate reductase